MEVNGLIREVTEKYHMKRSSQQRVPQECMNEKGAVPGV